MQPAARVGAAALGYLSWLGAGPVAAVAYGDGLLVTGLAGAAHGQPHPLGGGGCCSAGACSTIMALYWLENGIIGLYNVLKMLLSRGGAMGSVNKAFTIPFFIVHYGLPWAVHGIFVFLLFSEGSLFSSGLSFRTGFDPFAMPEIALHLVTTSGALAVAALSLVLSHGVSFAANFVGRGEYRRLGLQQLMSQPYGRVMILHITLIFGGFAIMVLGEPLLVLVLMIGIKIAVDASAHVREHRDRGGESPDGS